MSLHNLALQLSLYISKVVLKASILRLHGQQATHQKFRPSTNFMNSNIDPLHPHTGL